MKNLKVSLKLVFSFLVVIALAVIVGGIGIFGMYSINKADNELYTGNYLPTVMAGDISETVVRQRMIMRDFVVYDVTENADIFKNSQASFEEMKNKMEALIAEYDPTIVNQADREAFDEFVKVYHDEWLPVINSVHDFGVANQIEASKAALTAGAAVAGKMDTLTTELQEINKSDGKISVDNNSALFMTMALVEVGFLVLAIVIALILVAYISGLISKPLVVLTEFMKKSSSTGDINLTQADMENIKEFSKAKDEVGECIGATAEFIERLHKIGDVLQTVADGDLTSELSLLSDRDTMGLSLNKMMTNLNNMFNEISNATSQVSTGSRQVAEGSQSLAQGSTEQAAAVEELSSSISDIADKTRANADMADKAAHLADTIKSNAEKGNGQMNDMISAVQEINQASHSISNVIKVIDDIAFQTNILALNAAVEAARAGEAGKGFAVVAEEVRNLAAKSAEAAKNTGSLIANSMEKAELGASIANMTAESLNDIVVGINESAKIVSDIAVSSREQSGAITQINQGVEQVAQVVQQNSATAEQSAAASQEMNSQSDVLKGLVAQFKIK